MTSSPIYQREEKILSTSERDNMLISFVITGCVLVFILIGYMLWEANQLDIKEQELTLSDWPKGFEGVRFLFVTDLHRRSIPEGIRNELRQLIAEKNIDLVFIGGDITEKRVPLQKVQDNIRFLGSLAPSYFVWGNNDYSGDYRALDLMLREEGVTVLDNRAVSFEAGQDRLWLVGVDECSLKRDDLTMALADIEPPGYRLLLAHNPIIIKKIKKEDQIRGVLSGHTHGGQICLPLIGPISLPAGSFLRTYIAGEYTLQEGQLKLFVSKGVGTSALPFRLLARPELHILTMKSQG
jgi:predicted MPP superfamily phosphohydrolase